MAGNMSSFDSPIPLSEIESVLAWVDSFKLSRPTKKINRDFSDAVLLAEILSVHYPKLVEMHNYPPRNSQSLKLNNWLTLNRKVLKKLKLNLCINTMEQLANCHSGVIERVLVMVRDKIRRDEDLNKSMKDTEQNMSSGGSFYEACGEEENVLVVPVKTRVNGVLETVQQKVVNYESYLALKEELKDAKDSADLLRQKVEHLDNLLKLKEERIDELQKQLDRKQARRKEAEAFQNSLQVPFESVPSPVVPTLPNPPIALPVKTSSKSVEVNIKQTKEESKIPVKSDSSIKLAVNSRYSITEITDNEFTNDDKDNGDKSAVNNGVSLGITNLSYTKFPVKNSIENLNKNVLVDHDEVKNIKNDFAEFVNNQREIDVDVDRIKSDVFKEIEIIDEKPEYEEFKDSEQDAVTTIEQTIQKEIKNITNPMAFMEDLNC